MAGRTDEQALAAWFYALQLMYTEVRPDGTRVIKRDAVEVKDALKSVDRMLSDLDYMLDYKDHDFDKWLGYLGMRPALERAEIKWAYVRQRLNAVKLHADFLSLLGLPSIEEGIGSKTYDVRILYPRTNLSEHLRFMAPYIDAAKKDGLLQRIETLTVVFDETYNEKQPTDLYDSSKFQWVAAKYGMEVLTYKVIRPGEQPKEKAGDYIEAYRLRFIEATSTNGGQKQVTLERESEPILRAFRSKNSDRIDFAVLDLDLRGQYGYGMPDLIKTFLGLQTGADVFVKVFDGDVRALFKGRPVNRLRERPPYTPPISLFIVKSGTKVGEEWEMGNWYVPFDYKADTSVLSVNFVKETEDRRIKTVRYYEKTYLGAKRALERWLPKPEYAQVLSAQTDAGIFVVRTEGKPEARGPVEYVGLRIFSFIYQFGVTDYEIRDEDGDGRFERRHAIKWNW